MESVHFELSKPYLSFKEKNHALKQMVNIRHAEFLGSVFASSTFTIKNKINLLKYLENNLKTVLSTKDSPTKVVKLMPFLMTGISIVESILKYKDNPSVLETICDKEVIGYLKNVSIACWGINNQYIRTLSGVLYAKIFAISVKEVTHEALLQ